MTGPEFAAAHGNDSTDWMPADFETAEVLADIDAHTQGGLLVLLPHRPPTPAA